MQLTPPSVETFDALRGLPVVHGFLRRAPGLSFRSNREQALQDLEMLHQAFFSQPERASYRLAKAAQVHGNGVAWATFETAEAPYPGVDALVTCDPRICLTIRVADCAAVYLVDPVTRCLGLAHSGRKGTEQGVVPATLELMCREGGAHPRNVVAQIGPCIRPPLYEVDFAKTIREQLKEAGVDRIHDCGTCTGANTTDYYSYRVEKGQTGRLVAFLALNSNVAPAK